MSKDFRASQIETSKLIASGGISGTTVGLAIYSGSIAADRAGAVSDAAIFNGVGSDVFLFISGSKSNSDFNRSQVSLFGGDVVISGTLYAERQVIEVDGIVDGDMIITASLFLEPDTDSKDAVVFRRADGTDVFVLNTSDKIIEITGSLSQGQGTQSTGVYSHAEGRQTNTIYGEYSHAEGYLTTASGDYSHTEGYLTKTARESLYTHAAGIGTLASGSGQFVVGKYNKRDNSDALFVVGFGSGDDNSQRDDMFLVNSGSVVVGSGILGTDVNFYVTGSKSTKGTAIKGTSVFAGDIVISGSAHFESGLSGSLTQLTDGSSYLIAGSNITITSASNGGITISSTGGVAGNDVDWTDGGNKLVTTSSVSIDSDNNYADTYGSDVFFFVSGSKDSKELSVNGTAVFGGDTVISGAIYSGRLIALEDQNSYIKVNLGNVELLSDQTVKIHHRSGDPNTGFDTNFFVSGTIGSIGTSTRGTSTFGGDVSVSGSIISRSGLSGSLTQLSDGTSYLIAGSNITITSASNGSIIISAQDDDTLYTAGTGLILDTGEFSINDSVVATISGSDFSGIVKAPAFSGSLTQLEDGTSYIIAGSNITIISSSNGSIEISSTDTNTTYTAGNGLDLSSTEFSIDDSIVATISGSTFTGATKHNQGLSGSLTQLIDGSSYLIAGTNITITSASNGAVTISSLGSSNITVTDNTIENGTLYPTFVDGTSGGQEIEVDSSGLTYNPSSNTLTTSTFSGNLSGNATSADTIDTTATSTDQDYYLTFVENSSTTAGETLRVDSGITYNPSTNDLSTAGYFQTDKGIKRPTSVLVNSSISTSENQWLKIAKSFGSHDNQHTTFASLLVYFGGPEISDLYDGDQAYIINIKYTASSSTPYYSDFGTYITVEPLHAGNLNNFDPSTDVQITFDNSALPTVVELWVKSKESHRRCFVTHLGGTQTEDGSYVDPGFEILTGESMSASVTSLGTDIFGEWSSKVFNNIKAYTGLSGSLTQLTDGTSYLVASSNITITSSSNGQVQISAPNVQTSLQYYAEYSSPPSFAPPTAPGLESVAIGENSLAEGNNQFVAGKNLTASLGYSLLPRSGDNILGSDNKIYGFGSYASIGGGYLNQISGSFYSKISGGNQNQIKGNTLEAYALDSSDISAYHYIGGGRQNAIVIPSITIPSLYNVIAGGYQNFVSSSIGSFLGGGESNLIGSNESTGYAVICGGYQNNIAGDYNTGPGSFSSILGGIQNYTTKTYTSLIGSYLTASNAYEVKIGFGPNSPEPGTVYLNANVITSSGNINVGGLTLSNNTIPAITGSGDLGILSTGDITLDAVGNNIYFKNNGTDRLNFEIGSTSPGIFATGNLMLDASSDIYLDADGGQIYMRDNGSTYLTFNVNGTTDSIAATGNLTLDASGDISLDAAGDQIYFKKNGITNFTFEMNDNGSTFITGSNNLFIRTPLTLGLKSSGGTISILDGGADETAWANFESSTNRYLEISGHTVPSSIARTSHSKLWLKGGDSSDASCYIQMHGTVDSGIMFGDVADDNVGKIAYYHTGEYMYFTAGATEAVRIYGGLAESLQTDNAIDTGADFFTNGHQYYSNIDNEEITVGDCCVLSNGVLVKSNQPRQKNVAGIAWFKIADKKEADQWSHSVLDIANSTRENKIYISKKWRDSLNVEVDRAIQDESGNWVATDSFRALWKVASIGDSRQPVSSNIDDLLGFKVCNEGGHVEEGDLLCTSSIPGYLMKQEDDVIRSYTVGKAMENVTFDANGKAINVYGYIYCG